MSKLIPLHDFISENHCDFPFPSAELSSILNAIEKAGKNISKDIRKAGLVDHILGAKGLQNIQGEEQQKLDVPPDLLSLKRQLN